MAWGEIFLEEIQNTHLHDNGYAIVPFLNTEEIKSLTEYFYANHQSLPDGMYASSHSPDFEFRKKMNDEIKRLCQRAIDATFHEVAPLGATFMVKSKGKNGSLHPHQDWNIVDETEFNSYNIWLPLVDVDEENGTILILPNSHKLFNNIRGQNIKSSFEEVVNEVWKYLIPIKMKAGEALIYDHRLLHASGINKTELPRLVIVYGLIPSGATMRYYFGREDKIEEYECTASFYFSENITQGPTGLTLLKSFKNNNPILSLEKLKEIYSPRLSFFQRIMNAFK